MNQPKLKTSCKFWLFSLAMLVLFLQGCATTQPTSVDPLAYKSRTKSITYEDVTVTVAVPTISEAQALYGVDLASKHIQPVWVKVKNDSDDIYWFLPSGLDPDYFFPSEAAFVFKTDNENFQELQFKNPIRPGSTQSGFVACMFSDINFNNLEELYFIRYSQCIKVQ
jgi:hypothetical protein